MIHNLKGVIVEGCDCSGKTTLVRRLKAELSSVGWDVLDIGHKPGDQFKRYMKVYLEADGMLFDRGHFSEVVYGDLWRNGKHFLAWERELLDTTTHDRFITVVCTAPREALEQRYFERQYSQTIDKNELPIVQKRFLDVLSNQDPIVYQSTNELQLRNTVAQVIRRLKLVGHERNVLKARPKPSTQRPEFVILEGANGSGKSTLAKQLKVHLVGWHVTTLDYDDHRPPFERFMGDYLHADRAIFDRGHFSEVVYGDLHRQGRHFTPSELRFLNEYLRCHGILVLCDANPETLLARVLNAHHEKHVNPEKLPQISEHFRNAVNRSGLPYLIARSDEPGNLDKVVAEVRARVGGKTYREMGWHL